MNTPLLSIVMPVYNTEKFIKETINSLLNQTFKDFELLIVDDASTDNSIEIIKSFIDERIKIFTNDKNRGIVYSRNRGNSLACGKYIAPFDADDIALPDKFEKQITYMEKHTEFGMIGSWAKLIDENGIFKNVNWKLSASAKQIPAILLFRAYFIQSAVVFKKNVLQAYSYTEGYAPSEDYKLYYDISCKYKTYNYPEYLTLYRIHKNSITQSKKLLCKESELKLYQYIYKPLGIEIDDKKYEVLLNIKNHESLQINHLKNIEEFLLLILHQNLKHKIYENKQLKKEIMNRWIKVCLKSKRNLIKTTSIFLFSPLLINFLQRRKKI
jgi:glycosyltransferase involved in cell wall biosynthesis